MIVLDANLLIYAVNEDAPQHNAVRVWLERTLSAGEEVRLPWVVILAFLRLTTHPRLFTKPMTIEAAFDFVDDWLSQPGVAVLHPGPAHGKIFRKLLEANGAAGNLTSDAHLAAIAIEYGATLVSLDHDFARFTGLKWKKPVTNVP